MSPIDIGYHSEEFRLESGNYEEPGCLEGTRMRETDGGGSWEGESL